VKFVQQESGGKVTHKQMEYWGRAAAFVQEEFTNAQVPILVADKDFHAEQWLLSCWQVVLLLSIAYLNIHHHLCSLQCHDVMIGLK